MANKTYDPINKVFATRLKLLRERKEYTQQHVSDKTGIARVKIARFETEKATPDPNSLIKLSDLFGVSIEYLLGLEDYPDYLFDLTDYYLLEPRELNEFAQNKSNPNLSQEDELKLEWLRLYQVLLNLLKKFNIPNHTSIVKIIDNIIQISYKENSKETILIIEDFINKLSEKNNIYSLIYKLKCESEYHLKNFLLSFLNGKE